MRPLRVLLVAGSYPPMHCGVGDYIARLARALAQRSDIDVAVLTDEQAQSGQPIDAGRGVALFPVVRGWRPTDVARVVRVAREWRPDVVHLQYPALGFGLRWLPLFLHAIHRALGVPVVETWHEYYPSGRWRSVWRAGFRGDVIAVRPAYEAQMPGWYRALVARKRFHFIPNASVIPQARLTESERRAVRFEYAPDGRRLVTYFGFLYPHKGVEQLFEIADPQRDQLVLIGHFSPDDPYHADILRLAKSGPWAGLVTLAGFLPEESVARVLAASDAVVLPFRSGGGNWNTSLRGAVTQGTYVVTTSLERAGYDPAQHVHYATPDDVAEMRRALSQRIGERGQVPARSPADEWREIAEAHSRVYDSLCVLSRTRKA